MKTIPLLRAALRYAQLGWHVFPLHSVRAKRCSCGNAKCGKNAGKHPRTPNGHKDATTDETQIRTWWRQWPDAHIGIRTGKISGVVVLDVDPRNGGDNSLAALTKTHGELPLGPCAKTGGGGAHHFFGYPKRREVGCQNNSDIGLDIKGDGGYVVASPSGHVLGVYAWLAGQGPALALPKLPAWLLPSITPTSSTPKVKVAASTPFDSVLDVTREAGHVPIAKGKEWLIRCPQHDDKRPSLRMNVEKNAFYCDPCGEGGGPRELRRWFGLPPKPPYYVVNGQLCWEKQTSKGDVLEPLSNFDARIDEEVVFDDGVETKKVLVLSGKMLDRGAPLRRIRVKAEEFGQLGWVTKEWGAQAVVFAGRTSDRLREAIQRRSTPTISTVFRHTGWRDVNGSMVYLHGAGAIGAEGVCVELNAPLDRLSFPARTEDVKEAVLCSLSVLRCAPLAVTVPLLAATYLAPLMESLVPDFALWLVGTSGSLKTELASLAQRHFGERFDRKHLPADWTSTDNALEGIVFRLKDAVCVIDDYAPQADYAAQQKQAQKAARIVRGIGNGSSRSRLNADLSERPNRPPRAVVISTGEDTPTVASIIARLVVLEVDRERVNLKRLTSVQNRADRLAHAMRGYIEWLSPQFTSLGTILKEQQRDAAATFAIKNSHLRLADAVSRLSVAFSWFLRFALEVGALDENARRRLEQKGRKALVKAAQTQRDNQIERDPASRFVEALKSGFDSGRVGLQEHKSAALSDRTTARELIGWLDGDNALLKPDLARAVVADFMRRQGESLPLSNKAMNKLLVERGFIHRGTDNRSDVQMHVGGGRHRVLVMPLQVLGIETSRATRSPFRLVPKHASSTTSGGLRRGAEAATIGSDDDEDEHPDLSPVAPQPNRGEPSHGKRKSAHA